MIAWLQILASKNTDAAAPLVGVKEVCEAHWKEYGRNYYARYDYEGVDKPAAEKMIADMVEAAPGLVGKELGGMKVATADMFQYDDPVDGSVSKNQGVRVIFDDGSRFVFRLSGTGVAGATIRMYMEKYMPPTGDLALHAFDVVKPIADIALESVAESILGEVREHPVGPHGTPPDGLRLRAERLREAAGCA